MNVIVLCCGDSKRMGKGVYKPLFQVDSKSIVKHTTDSLPFLVSETTRQNNNVNLYFAIRKNHNQKFKVKTKLTELYGYNTQFIIFSQPTEGNLQTAYTSCQLIDEPDEELLILDSDNAYYNNGFMDFLRDKKRAVESGLLKRDYAAICYFNAMDIESKWCFAIVRDGIVTGLREKDNRCGKPMVGVFYFSSTKIFIDAAKKIFDNNEKVKDEFYMSQSISTLLKGNISVFSHEVKNVIPLGTKEDAIKARNTLSSLG